MKIFRTVALAIFLPIATVSCATPGDVRSTPPIVETTSVKPAKVVAGCVADKFELSFRSGVNSRPTSKGYSVWKEDDLRIYGKITALVVDVDESPSGSTIRFYSKGALSSAMETAAKAVEECKR